MKINCSACGAKNEKTNSECQYCGASLITNTKNSLINSSDSQINMGISLYKKENYSKAEEILLEVLEKNQNNLIANLYLALTLNKKSGDFLTLKEDIEGLLKSTNNEADKDIIYKGLFANLESWLKPSIKRISTTKSEIEFDYIASTISDDDEHEEFEKLTELFAFIATFPKNYSKQFLQILIKRYQLPWANSWKNPSHCWPIHELALIKELDSALKQNNEETRMLFSTISEMHVQVIKLMLEALKAEGDPYKYRAKVIIEWNDKIKNFFDSFDFTESELGFSHSARIEPYLLDLNKYLASNSENSESKGSKPGCFIVTAAMGDYNHPVVVELRQFRDEWLLKRAWGISFTNWYYTHGPKAANVIEKSNILKTITFLFIVKPLQKITQLVK